MGNLSKYSYTYNRNAGPKPELRYYTRDELELMTTYQLVSYTHLTLPTKRIV